MPSLVLRGVGEALVGEGVEEDEQETTKKVLVLNATIDRETGPKTKPMTATDFVRAVAKAGEQSRRSSSSSSSDPHYHDRDRAAEETDSTSTDDGQEEEGRRLLRKYVTHLIYLDGQEVGGRLARFGNAPVVDVEELEGLFGIKCVKVEGRVQEDGKGVRYDEGGLGEALEGIMDE